MSRPQYCSGCRAQVLPGWDDELCESCLLGTALEPSAADASAGNAEDVPASIGHYAVIRRISRGGMGEIYLGEQDHPHRRVAIKVLRRDAATSVSERLWREPQTLAAMEHPNIARVYEADILPDGRPYFAMEYLEGMPVTEHCDRESLDIWERLVLFTSICEAVHHAHQKGVIHRDIKPSNVLIITEDGRPVPKVIDFGIAKAVAGGLALDQTLTRIDEVVGTPGYMSPEQTIPGTHIDVRSDVYSLGVLLYELMTRTLPFEVVGPPDEILRRIREEDPPLPSRRVLRVSRETQNIPRLKTTGAKHAARALKGDLDSIILKSLDKDPARRYRSVSEMAADLRRWLDDEPVEARRASAIYRATKFARRHRAGVLYASAAFLVLVLALAAMVRMYLRAEWARKEALRTGYLASVRAAAASLRENDGGEARRALEACDVTLRGWEWRHLRRRTELSLAVQDLGGERVWAAWSPDGSRVAAACGDGALRLWDPVSRRILARLDGPGGSLNAVSFSSDGRRVAAIASGGSLRLWDAATGVTLATILAGLGHLNALDWSPDGRLIAAGGEQAEIRIWNAYSGEMAEELKGHPSGTNNVRFSPDSSRLASSSLDGVRLWDLRTNRLLRILGNSSVMPQSLAFSPDGEVVGVASLDRTVRLWDARTGELRGTFVGPPGFANDVEFSPSGHQLAATGGKTALVWDVSTGNALATLLGHEGYVYSVVFSPDGRRLVTGSDDETIRIWSADAPDTPLQMRGHTGPVRVVAYVPGGTQLVSGGADGTVRIWQREPGEELRVIAAHKGAVLALAVSPDGSLIASGGGEGEIRLWEIATGRLVTVLHVASGPVADLAWSPEGTRIASCSDTEVMIWEFASGILSYTFRPSSRRVMGIRFSPVGDHLVVAGWGGSEICDLKGKAPICRSLSKGNANKAVFDPLGDAALLATWEGNIEVYEVTSGRRLLILPSHGSITNAVVVSPNGDRIASGSSEGLLRIWERHSGELLVSLWGHNDSISSLAWSPDGREIASASSDGAILLWRD